MTIKTALNNYEFYNFDLEQKDLITLNQNSHMKYNDSASCQLFHFQYRRKRILEDKHTKCVMTHALKIFKQFHFE